MSVCVCVTKKSLQMTHMLLDWGKTEHLEKSQSRRKRGRRWQWWEVNTMPPPEADKLLSWDCCWPPEMAVNSCIILFLHSSFLLPPLLFCFLFHCICPTFFCACLFVSDGRWHGLILDHDETGLHLGRDPHACAWKHKNNGQCICEFCQRSNQVTICCVSVWCLLERVGVCWFFSHFSWAELLANTHSFVLFVSFWTGFLWASFPLLVHYCTVANLSTSVKH